MTKCNIFCHADKEGDKNSFQQARYRIFNTQVTKEEYENIEVPKITLEFDKDRSYTTRYQTAFKKAWAKLSKDEKDTFLNLPYFDADIFFKITGVNVRGEETITIDGKTYQVTDELKSALKKLKEID
jgi:hypothetical protein